MTAPTVYFIDDSATMREVIKIAFRRENIEVVACHDGDSAIAQMSQQKPDVVITDVIMPGKDGYDVCQTIKQSPGLSGTPVVLMSGVVNRQVAEKAFAVKADELIRKPFQPGDLIARVRQLLSKNGHQNAPTPVVPVQPPIPASVVPQVQPQSQPQVSAAATLSSIFAAPRNGNGGYGNGHIQRTAPPAAAAQAVAPVSVAPAPSRIGTFGADVAKLRVEVLRLEQLVKKLQSELQAEREYARALEEHIKTLQETE